jgi:hypothetical protein
MIAKIEVLFHNLQSFVTSKLEFAIGGTSGSIMGFYLWQNNFITWIGNLFLAIVFSLITGAAGTLGGLIIKQLWEKRRRKNADPS